MSLPLLLLLLMSIDASAGEDVQVLIRDNTDSTRLAIGCDVQVAPPFTLLGVSVWLQKMDLQWPVMRGRFSIEVIRSSAMWVKPIVLHTRMNLDFSPNASYRFAAKGVPLLSFWLQPPPSSHCGRYWCVAEFGNGERRISEVLHIGDGYTFCMHCFYKPFVGRALAEIPFDDLITL